MIKVVALALACMTAAAHADGRVPSLLVSTDWGFTGDSDFDLHLAGGLGVAKRWQRPRSLVQLEGTALFFGGVFAGRLNVVLGTSYALHYSELISSTTTGNTTTNTYLVYPQKIRGVLGLDLGITARSSDYGDHQNLIFEGGFGMFGQGVAELVGLYDVTNAYPGIRLNTIYGLGGKDGAGGIRMSVEAFFDEDAPITVFALFGLAFGSGYHW